MGQKTVMADINFVVSLECQSRIAEVKLLKPKISRKIK
jgi:hypothetical protein